MNIADKIFKINIVQEQYFVFYSILYDEMLFTNSVGGFDWGDHGKQYVRVCINKNFYLKYFLNDKNIYQHFNDAFANDLIYFLNNYNDINKIWLVPFNNEPDFTKVLKVS